MTNDLGTLNTALSTALRETHEPGKETWTSEELDDILTWSAARTYPKIADRLRESVTLVSDQSEYELTTLSEIDRVDILDSDDVLMYHLPGGTWEFWGSGEERGGTLYVNPHFVSTNWSLRVHGYAPYDLNENPPPDRYVPWIIAMARADAGRREIARRMNSKNWLTVNQVQNVSVNELVQMVNEADFEARTLGSQAKTWRRPKYASR